MSGGECPGLIERAPRLLYGSLPMPGPARRSPLCTATHRNYLMTCEEFVELRDQCDNRCELCGLPGERNDRGFLFIDHARHVGRWAVRGLLCNPCNTQLKSGTGANLTDKQRAYVAGAWWHRFDLSLKVEPADATEVVGRWYTRWERRRDGWYDSGQHRTWKWHDIYATRGPHLEVTRCNARTAEAG